MISILIPVYNWDITSLVQDLHDQCMAQNIAFEIIALDDQSPDQTKTAVNQALKLSHFTYQIAPKNFGNGENRNALAKLAKYDWLLFLDADTLPTTKDFVKRYISLTSETSPAIVFCGGLAYREESIKDGVLRWKYGMQLEVQTPIEAQKNPYLNFKSCNFLIHRETMLASPFIRMPESYGFDDTSFALSLEKFGVKINYVDNPIYHLGLEPNEIFIQKQKSSVKNAFWMIKNRPEIAQQLRIIRLYKKLKSFGLNYPISWLFTLSEPFLLSNLKSKNPSIFLFQIYKLGYLCALREA